MWALGLKQGTAQHTAAMRELDRRSQGPANRRAKIALLVTLGSFLIAAIVALRIFGML